MRFLKNIRSSDLPDEELAARYRTSGDLDTAGILYGRYMELVYGVCLNYLKDEEEAKDSTLAIFEELVTKLRRHEVAHFRAWVHQVAKNHCLMRLRSDKKFSKAAVDVSLMQNEEDLHLNGVLEKEEQFRQLSRCLEELNSEQRQAVELFYLQGKCYKEIAGATGLDWNKVRSYIQNGRRNLKNCMEKNANIPISL